MHICFRVDSSDKIGTGHVMRCLTLADELGKAGHDILFICSDLTGNIGSFIKKKGYNIHLFRHHEKSQDKLTPLTFNWKMDVDKTITVLKEVTYQVDWLIIDHYEISENWEVMIRPFVKKIMVIDDLANRKHDCDILLDQMYGETGERYKGLLSPHCKGLFGINYALLRSQFREHKKKHFVFNKNKVTIHVFFGGNDHKNYTGKFCKILLENFPQFNLKAVVGANYLHLDCLNELKNQYDKRFQWKQNLENMAAYMAECDLSIGAAGTTTWERACVGLPSAYLSIHNNQKDILKTLEKRGFCVFLGDADTIENHYFVKLTKQFINDENRIIEIYKKCNQSVDGLGTQRIIKTLLS